LELRHETIGVAGLDQALVEVRAKKACCGCDRVADHDRPLLTTPTERPLPALRDDRDAEQAAESAASKCERGVLHLLGPQPPRARALGQIAQLARDLRDALAVRAPDDRHDQAAIESTLMPTLTSLCDTCAARPSSR